MLTFTLHAEESSAAEAAALAEIGDEVVLMTQDAARIRVELKASSLLGTMSGVITSDVPEAITDVYGVAKGSNVAFDKKNIMDVFPK